MYAIYGNIQYTPNVSNIPYMDPMGSLVNLIDHELPISGKSFGMVYGLGSTMIYQLAIHVPIPNILAKLASSLNVGWRRTASPCLQIRQIP